MPNQEPKIGVLITNLGSPSNPDKQSVKKYLAQFLSDPRVIQPTIPRWIWWLILHGVILKTRPKKSALLYQSIWNRFGKGSPLVDMTKKQGLALNNSNVKLHVEIGMRYGEPSIEKGLERLCSKNVDQIIILPLYPQYSRTTTESTFDCVHAFAKNQDTFPPLTLINDYHQHPLYIQALTHSVKKYWATHSKSQKLIISFHGIPKIYCDKGDIYPQHCYTTAKLLVESLQLQVDEYLICFQSRFGKLEWLQPYLNQTLRSLPEQGITDVQVICPGFSADCLETLEEIEQENKRYFMQSGGQKYGYIPALNDSKAHMECLQEITEDAMGLKS